MHLNVIDSRRFVQFTCLHPSTLPAPSSSLVRFVPAGVPAAEDWNPLSSRLIYGRTTSYYTMPAPIVYMLPNLISFNTAANRAAQYDVYAYGYIRNAEHDDDLTVIRSVQCGQCSIAIRLVNENSKSWNKMLCTTYARNRLEALSGTDYVFLLICL